LSKIVNRGLDVPVIELLSLKIQVWIIILTGFVFYMNTLANQFALDDAIVLIENKFVKKGFSGIDELLTKDSFHGYLGESAELTGGRWRPLSLIVFSVEYSLFGKKALFFHLTNVVFYGLCCLAFFFLLRRFVFKKNTMLAFVGTLIFTIHPIHTEVVANIKSLDELMSFLFLILTLYHALKYIDEGRDSKYLRIALSCFALGLLSKENGITFLIILPISIYFLTKENIKSIFILFIPYLTVGVIYLTIRFYIFGNNSFKETEILNAPFLYASLEQSFATKILLLGKYIWLLIFPHPLSYDYSYNQIPYVDFKNPYVWVSIMIHAALVIFCILKLRQKDLLALAVLFYLISISIVSNFIVDIGAPLGERLLFQPSAGFAIGTAILLYLIYEKVKIIPSGKTLAVAFVVVIIFLSGFKTIQRNRDWKNNETLFLSDVKTSPNSLKANNAAGSSLILISDSEPDIIKKTAMLQQALIYYRKAMEIDSTIVDPYLNEGVAYERLGEVEKAEAEWNKARKISPNHTKLKEYDYILSVLFLKKGLSEAERKDYKKSLDYLHKSVKYNDRNGEALFHLAGVYYTTMDFDNAKKYLNEMLEKDSSNVLAPKARQGLVEMSAK
jgi:hypothetical protein